MKHLTEEKRVTDLQPHAQQTQNDAGQTIASLTARLEKVEGQLKGLQWAIPGLVILVVGSFLMGLNKPTLLDIKTVVAESVGVKNPKGDVVARLGTTSDGAPNIAFFDAQQKIRLMAALRADGGPSISLIDPQQVPRAVLSLNNQFDPSLTMFNAEKLPRTVLATDGADTGGNGHLIMYGAAGGLDLSPSNGRIRWNPKDGAPVDLLLVK
jgi:hypothetical protein